MSTFITNYKKVNEFVTLIGKYIFFKQKSIKKAVFKQYSMHVSQIIQYLMIMKKKAS